tara:strand:- start:3 stop:179 length:177 start_codon:yes stop_codon:yes gene_type:complete
MKRASLNPNLKAARYIVPKIRISVVAAKQDKKLFSGLDVRPFSARYPIRKAAITNPHK